jgi:vacuolar-type H+-ATPase subunit C/Vma6
LPLLALSVLAEQSSPHRVVQQLVLQSHPDAPRLLPIVRHTHIDLFALDVALLRGFASRAVRAANRDDAPLRDFVSAIVDVGNAHTALLLANESGNADAGAAFVEGGRWVSAQLFMSASAAGSAHQALQRLLASLVRSPVAAALPAVATDTTQLDTRRLHALLTWMERRARVEPLSTAPVLRMLLRLDAQTRDLRMLAWGAAIGAPAALRRRRLVTPQ